MGKKTTHLTLNNQYIGRPEKIVGEKKNRVRFSKTWEMGENGWKGKMR
jgi:hypothetical protein